jgi:hypothetical protein
MTYHLPFPPSQDPMAHFAQLLSERIDVNNSNILDDTSTEVLLAMKRECEVRCEKQKKLEAIQTVNSGTDSGTPHRTPFDLRPMVPSSG